MKENDKIKGMRYGILELNKLQLKGIFENIELCIAAFPIPRNLRERLENKISPRFREINDIIKSNKEIPEDFYIEISALNQEDLLYGLESLSLNLLLKERGFRPEELKCLIVRIKFTRF
ncbi:MAG: hypothetical protein ACTSRI_14565 [Promethearchaeota archaeon]